MNRSSLSAAVNEILNIKTGEVERQRFRSDYFCGAGGVSRAGVQAGLDLK